MLKRIQVFYLAKESNSILLFSHRLGWNTDFYFNIPRIQKSDTCQCRYDKYFLNGNILTFFQSKICNCCNDLRIQLPTDMWIRVKPLFTCSLSDSGSMLTEAAFHVLLCRVRLQECYSITNIWRHGKHFYRKANAFFFTSILGVLNQVLRNQEPYIVEEVSLSDVGKMPDPQNGSFFGFHLLRALVVVGGFDD